MFDYIPPEPGDEEPIKLNAGVLIACLVAGGLMWLGLIKSVEIIVGNAPW